MVEGDFVAATSENLFDFSKDGFQPVTGDFTLVSYETDTKENGVRAVLEFENPELPFPVKISEWLKHSNETAQRIGRGNLKKLATALTGQPSFPPAGPSIGSKLSAELYEDDKGFRRFRKLKAAGSEAAGTVSL